jgi:hypothetical protein
MNIHVFILFIKIQNKNALTKLEDANINYIKSSNP